MTRLTDLRPWSLLIVAASILARAIMTIEVMGRPERSANSPIDPARAGHRSSS